MGALLGLLPFGTAPGATGLTWAPDIHTVTSAPTLSEGEVTQHPNPWCSKESLAGLYGMSKYCLCSPGWESGMTAAASAGMNTANGTVLKLCCS